VNKDNKEAPVRWSDISDSLEASQEHWSAIRLNCFDPSQPKSEAGDIPRGSGEKRVAIPIPKGRPAHKSRRDGQGSKIGTLISRKS